MKQLEILESGVAHIDEMLRCRSVGFANKSATCLCDAELDDSLGGSGIGTSVSAAEERFGCTQAHHELCWSSASDHARMLAMGIHEPLDELTL